MKQPLLICLLLLLAVPSFSRGRKSEGTTVEVQSNLVQMMSYDASSFDRSGVWAHLIEEEEFDYRIVGNNLYLLLSERNYVVSILDLTGKQLFRTVKAGGKIHLNIRKGIYLMRINQKNIKLVI